jgi:hypothetical protein
MVYARLGRNTAAHRLSGQGRAPKRLQNLADFLVRVDLGHLRDEAMPLSVQAISSAQYFEGEALGQIRTDSLRRGQALMLRLELSGRRSSSHVIFHRTRD